MSAPQMGQALERDQLLLPMFESDRQPPSCM
jgi:hypothetical protein